MSWLTGEIHRYEVGWVELSLMDETIQSRVIFGPDNAEPILGVMALEAVRLVVDSTSQKSFASKLRNHSWTRTVSTGSGSDLVKRWESKS
jgi:hypothetical protein